jgi:DNA-binding NtrC family response regulator
MPHILVVEDDPFTLETYGLVLRVAGYDVGLAATRQQGLDALRVGVYDLVLADLALPDGDAIQLLSDMERGNLRVAVVVITGFGTIDTAVESMRLGAVDYVEKPLIGDDLLAKVQRALDKREPVVREAAPPPFTHPSERWARIVLRLRESDRDVPTVESWADRAERLACKLNSEDLPHSELSTEDRLTIRTGT